LLQIKTVIEEIDVETVGLQSKDGLAAHHGPLLCPTFFKFKYLD